MPASWSDPDSWSALVDGSRCPVCQEGPRDVVATLEASWVTVPPLTPLPGYVCVIARRHVVEPFEMALAERTAFWEEVNRVAAALHGALKPVKLNYEIHGNSLPHLHLHLFPRQRGDRFEGRPIDGRGSRWRPAAEVDAIRAALAPLETQEAERHAPLKDNAWREIGGIDARLERGEIDEAGWHAAMAQLVVPAYLAAKTPWEGSGKSGSAEDWEYARSHVAHAIDGDGSFLDVGCANGYLLERLPHWTAHRVDRYGLDIAPELVELARRRLPDIADQLFGGDAMDWEAPQRFRYVRTGLEYVPRHRRRELVERLLGWCDRLIIGVVNEEADARPTEGLVRSWGHTVAGRSERANRSKPGMEYRVLWIDSAHAR